MSFLDHPQIIPRENAYFAALNSYRGFSSCFSTLFAPYKKHIIKGGPGCGKSTLMKKVAKAAEEKGLSVLRYYCSSDTDSLDAVAIPSLSTVILDGTPPHAIEPQSVGAVDSIVNLTSFWNQTLLQNASEKIKTLSQSISLSYRRAYALMAAIHEIENAIRYSTEEVFDKKRSETIIFRLLEKHRIKEEENPSVIVQPATAFGTRGYVHLNSYETNAQTLIGIKDRIVYSEHFFTLLKEILLQKKISFYESIRPVDEHTESIYLPKNKLLFTRLDTSLDGGKINLDRMLPERGKGALASHKVFLHQIEALCLAIEKILHEIGKQHDALESFYINATDYKALDQFSETFIQTLFQT